MVVISAAMLWMFRRHGLAVNRIHRLPPALANQIAAGEVVERPASVVKELVENAVDAGAPRVDDHRSSSAARSSSSVEDDGDGMTPEDAELAIERHATSKIRTRRGSGGDRHAGLPRRGAAVDRVGLALPAADAGARRARRHRAARSRRARLLSTSEVGAPEGTLVEVADLFFNLPARRKFLKADTAESAQISRLVTQLALGYPEVGFVLEERRARAARGAAGRIDRGALLSDLRRSVRTSCRSRKQAAGIAVRGFVAALGEQGPVRGPQHVFVNRRIVRDRTITHAIQQAYSVATIKERSPEVHLFIELRARSRRRERPPDQGRGAVPRSGARARGPAARDRRRARRARARRSWCSSGQRARGGRACPARRALPLGFAARVAGVAERAGSAAATGSPGGRPAAPAFVAAAVPGRTDPRVGDARRAARRSARSSGRWRRSASSATRSSSRSTTRGSRSSISTSRTSGSCSSRSPSG